jgi:CheY-like chemotaxis protein
VLVVEDHPDTRRVMVRLLAQMNLDVACAADVRSALQIAEQTRFDLLISDLGLPDGSGCDLMRQLKQRYALRGIALSGYASPADIHQSLAAGFDSHLTKPTTLQGLLEQIRRVTGGT